MVNFMRGLIDESGDAEDRNKENAKILEPYADALMMMETPYKYYSDSLSQELRTSSGVSALTA
jgi:hypothetical protein